ncbi:hypothetical protein [Halobacillus litoralis]|nr:hypothetical protein [Halobacillus litoralis]MCA1022282.1 hypothetical protein [Halobacillus litoralis]
MRQEEAVDALLKSLKADPLVKAVFLKGSMEEGRKMTIRMSTFTFL